MGAGTFATDLHRATLQYTAEDGVRTRDPQLGKLMLYQLSYFRELTLVIEKFNWIKTR